MYWTKVMDHFQNPRNVGRSTPTALAAAMPFAAILCGFI